MYEGKGSGNSVGLGCFKKLLRYIAIEVTCRRPNTAHYAQLDGKQSISPSEILHSVIREKTCPSASSSLPFPPISP